MPKFDVYVRMPTFVLDTDKLIEANVWAGAYWEKVFKGDIYLRLAFNELKLHYKVHQPKPSDFSGSDPF